MYKLQLIDIVIYGKYVIVLLLYSITILAFYNTILAQIVATQVNKKITERRYKNKWGAKCNYIQSMPEEWCVKPYLRSAKVSIIVVSIYDLS